VAKNPEPDEKIRSLVPLASKGFDTTAPDDLESPPSGSRWARVRLRVWDVLWELLPNLLKGGTKTGAVLHELTTQADFEAAVLKLKELDAEEREETLRRLVDTIASELKLHHGEMSELKRQLDGITRDQRVQTAALCEGPDRRPARELLHFRGRDRELADLETLLRGDARTSCVVITGIGGVGKTTLVREFVATRAPDLFPDGVSWLNAHDLVAELARVSERFGWTHSRNPTPEEAVSLLSKALHSKRALLIIDDFASKEHDVAHIPIPGGQSRTLVTTRSQVLALALDAVSLPLDVWALDACRQYVHDKCPWLQSDHAAKIDALTRFVGQLPLGVHLLVSVLQHRQSLKLSEVLKLLQEQQLLVLDSYHYRGIEATFNFAWELLTDDARCTLQTLAVCAQNTRTRTVEAVSVIQRANLENPKQPIEDVQNLLDDLHVRSFVELTIDADGEMRWGLHDIVRMFVHHQKSTAPAFAAAHTAWVCEYVKTHAAPAAREKLARERAEIRRGFERVVGCNWDQTTQLYRPLVDCLEALGRYSEALELHNLLLAKAERKKNFTALATALTNLGFCYRKLGYIPKAVRFLERVARDKATDWRRSQPSQLTE
jgi:tetratricopeptide (TPR) repeat protein